MFETILIILLLVILIYLVQFRKEFTQDMDELKNKLDKLEKEALSPPPAPRKVTRDEAISAPREEKAPPPKPPVAPEPPVVHPVPVFEAPPPYVPPTPVKEEEKPRPQQRHEPTMAAFTAPPAVEKEEEKPDFWERNPDLEKFIGENLFNKIGIAILVIGIGFFLKYAIDKNWINEIGRTFIGFLCGALLIGLAHYLRKSFTAFSSVLVGGGVAVLYFTVTIAFQQYHLIPQSVAFALMIVITAFTVLLSISYNRIELAILAILGGFSSPFLISTGQTNEVVFFTYLLILNIGMLVLAYYKKWNIVNIICYIATVALYGGWLVQNVPGEGRPGVALLFATLFYLVFFLMNVVNNIRNANKFSPVEILILLSNTFFYFAAGMLILHHWGGGAFQGMFTVLLALFNCIFAYSLYRNQRADRTLIFLLIGLVLTFMSLAAPIQLEGNYITLFWSAEAVLLYWLWQKSRIAQMRYASLLVMILMILSLMMDWKQIYFDGGSELFPFANKGFITGLVATAAIWLTRRLIKKEEPDREMFPGVDAGLLFNALGIVLIVLLYIIFSIELYQQLSHHAILLRGILMASFNYLYLIILWRLSRNSGNEVSYLLLLLSLCAGLTWPVMLNGQVINIRDAFHGQQAPFFYFLVHYIALALLVWIGVQAFNALKKVQLNGSDAAFKWIATTLILYTLSAELDHVLMLVTRNYDVLETSHRTGYAILWGLYAFVLMFLGLRLKSRMLRIISISVFGLTIAKLFIFDLRGLGEGGKIAAFISLGILLLLISFMYQRLKKIILTDEENKA